MRPSDASFIREAMCLHVKRTERFNCRARRKGLCQNSIHRIGWKEARPRAASVQPNSRARSSHAANKNIRLNGRPACMLLLTRKARRSVGFSCGSCLVMETEDRGTVQQKALEALQESTRTLEVAEQLVRVGNIKEAERLREKAREQRNVSVWLMRQVQGSEANPIGRPRNTTRDH